MLEMYVLETCPYCRKVMEYLKTHHIEYKEHDITIPENLENLVEIGRERQVPFLYDTDKDVKMYESDHIIEYLKENYVR